MELYCEFPLNGSGSFSLVKTVLKYEFSASALSLTVEHSLLPDRKGGMPLSSDLQVPLRAFLVLQILVTSPRFTSPRFTSPRFASPRRTNPRYTSPVHEMQYVTRLAAINI